jgi:toxin ParE1/3/4
MKVRYTATSLIEIDQIFAYIAERNFQAAVVVRGRIEGTIAALGDNPKMAQLTDEAGVRRMPVRSSPYLIFYTVKGDEIVILHVRHGARRYPWDEGV